jgi:hypothetical protein
VDARLTKLSHTDRIRYEAINGCCYGKNNQLDNGSYSKMCGQAFWEFLTKDDNFYVEIVEPLGKNVKKQNEEFEQKRAQIINKFTQHFLQHYCSDGTIDWTKLIEYNSGKTRSKK